MQIQKECRIFLLSTAALLAPCLTDAQFHHFGEALNTSPLGSECALILSGPGRSSVYDYSVNLFRGAIAHIPTQILGIFMAAIVRETSYFIIVAILTKMFPEIAST
ncbi:hypothetical protein DOY81_002480 [Sarcophaga bullata]|nr:hypothetical protein DOY81_002480 [Sarcophaga bullata]